MPDAERIGGADRCIASAPFFSLHAELR